MNPIKPFADWIAAQIAGMADVTPQTPAADVKARFDAMTVASSSASAPTITVPVPYTWDDVCEAFDSTSLRAIDELPQALDAKEALNRGDLVTVMRYLTNWTRAGIITAAQAAAALSLATRTQAVPDPSWTPQVSLARSLWGRDVDTDDIVSVRGH